MQTVAEPISGKPRSSDLMAILHQLESRFPVMEWRVAGIQIWPLLRIRWFFSEWARHYVVETQPRKGGAVRANLKRLGSLVRQLPREIQNSLCSRNINVAQNKRAIFLSDGVSFAKLGDCWIERFCDPLIRAAEGYGFIPHLWAPVEFSGSPLSKPMTVLRDEIFFATFAGLLRARLLTTPLVLPGQSELVDYLGVIGCNTASFEIPKIVSDACRLRSVADAYRKRISKSRPEVAFIVSYYSLEGMAFVLACRESGVHVVDIQHGVQGDLHPAYAAWTMGNGVKVTDLLPSRFWVWSRAEVESIERWSTGTCHEAFQGGNPWGSIWKTESEWPGVRDALRCAQSLRQLAGDRKIVLVTLQYGLAPEEQLLPLRDLVKLTNRDLVFWVRLHPLMLDRREEVREYVSHPSALLDIPSDLPLPALLSCVDIHMTHSSSTVIEAEELGIPSVLTSVFGAELFPDQLRRGAAVLEARGGDFLREKLLNFSAGAFEANRPSTDIAGQFARLIDGLPATDKEFA